MYGDLRVRGPFNNPVRDIHTWGSTIINHNFMYELFTDLSPQFWKKYPSKYMPILTIHYSNVYI